jgi:MFS family permease
MRQRGAFGRALGSLADAFRVPNLRRLEIAWSLSVTADWISTVALAVYAFSVGGALAVGVLGLIRMVPSGLAAPFMALPGDRYRRERVMMFVEAARALLIAVAAIAVVQSWPTAVLYLMVAVAAVITSAYRSTQYALLPSLARSPHELVAANVGLSTIEGLGMLVGPVLSGLLLAVTGTQTLLTVAAIGFAMAASLLARIQTDPRPSPVERSASEHHLREALIGFSTLRSDAQPRLIVGLFSAQTFVRGVLGVMIVVTAVDVLSLGQPAVGYLSAAIGAGGLIGVVVTLRLVGRPHLAEPFGIGLLAWGIPLLLIGMFPTPIFTFSMMVVIGIGNSVGDVAGMTTLQRIVPDRVLARVLGVLDGLVLAGIGLGGITAPALIGWLGPRGAYAATGIALSALVIITWPLLRKIDAATLIPEHELDLLRQIPLFAPLDIPTVDHLAQQLRERLIPAGTIVIREGDVGDRFYIIDHGHVDVTAGGAHVADLDSGGFFGEIALLKDVPRTATVTATMDSRLLSLEREEFLGAVTGFARSRSEADRVAAERLIELGR